MLQLGGVGGLQAQAITGGRDRGVQRQILHRMQVQANPGVVGIRVGQPADHHGTAVALAVGLEVDQQVALIDRRVGLIDADEGRQARHRRIAQDSRGQPLLFNRHFLERNGR